MELGELKPEETEALFRLVDGVLTKDPVAYGLDQQQASDLRRKLSWARELSPGWTVEDEIRAKTR